MKKVRRSIFLGQQHWLKSYGLSPRFVFLLAIFWIVAFLTFAEFGVGTYLESKIAAPINFRLRDVAGRSPVQDSHLKIYAIDDRTFAMLGTPMPSLELWADILDSIAAKKPKLIIIDAMFSANGMELTERARKLLTHVKNSGIPIATGGFVSRDLLEFKNPLKLTLVQNQLSQYVSKDLVAHSSDLQHQVPPWMDRSSWKAYGPSAAVEEFFDSVGHFQLFEENMVEPFVKLGPELYLPHLSMLVAESVSFYGGSLLVNGQQIALDNNGATPVNFIPKSHLNIRSMLPLIEDARGGYTASHISEGDVVLLLPMYFTGNVDLRPSPYGWIPGGVYLAASINSVMTGNWLQPVLVQESLIVVLIGLATVLGFFCPPGWFFIAWGGFLIAMFSAVQVLFSWGGLVIPYVLAMFGGTIAGIHIFVLKVKSAERSSLALRVALDGAIAPGELANLMKKPERMNLEPRERIVTLMFIDVVGFSLSSENMLPRLAFDNLKTILNQLSDVIHEFGGVVDKTLGDGLLCYFGYRFDTDETNSDHPERAIRCALKIQEQSLNSSLAAFRTGAPIYPLRIGVNTASCYLGDLGSGARIEFTVVGNGVNFAKRLEAACEMYCVMIGATTFDLVKGLDFGVQRFSRKMIKIKHHADLIDAYEIDGLMNRHEERNAVIEAFRRIANLQRINERMAIKDSESIRVQSRVGPGSLLNFSGTGVNVCFKTALSRGTSIELSFSSRAPGLAEELDALGMKTIEGEVRWSYLAGQGVAHGVMFRNLTTVQHEHFARLLMEYAYLEQNELAKDDYEAQNTHAS